MFSMFSGTSDGVRHFGDWCGRHFDCGARGGGRLPAGGQQGTEVVLIGHPTSPLALRRFIRYPPKQR